MTDFIPTHHWLSLVTRVLVFTLLPGFAVLPVLAQTTRYVSTTGTNTNPANATSWATSTADLQGAINASNTNDQVWVATGTFKPQIPNPDISRLYSFSMKNGVGIYGGFTGTETLLSQRPALNPVAGPGGASQPSGTILSGDIGTPGDASDNSYHVINNTNLNTSALLDGVVITGGQASPYIGTDNGAGMYNDGSIGSGCSPTIRNCSFLNNAAGSGSGGGMYNNGQSSATNPVVENCLFQGNSARINGGAVGNLAFNLTITPRFTNCAFIGNSSDSPGGGMYNAGVINGNCSPTLINCSFLNNTTGSEGGGMYNNDFQGGRCTPILINCSFRGNGGSAGQAISNADVSSSVQLNNCVLFGNNGNNTFKRNGGTITVLNSYLESTITDYTTSPTNLTSTTSPFTVAGTQLASGSGAINTGVNSVYAAVGGPPLDLAGNPRTLGTLGTLGTNCTIDMGAYEFQSGFPVGITGGPVASSVVCPDATVTASVSTSGTVTGYQWYQNGTALGTQTTATLSLANVAVSASGNYVVVVSGSCNSVTSTAFSLTVNSPPSVSLTPAAVSICAGNATTLTASGGVSYTFGGPTIVAQTGTQITVNQTGIYSVTAIGTNGCSGTGSATVSLHTATQATLQASSLSLCAGGAVTLTAGSGATYAFSGPNLGQIGSSPTAIATQSGTYSVLVTGSNGCTASAGVSLTINPDPTAVVTFPNGTTVQGTGVAIITLPPFTTPVLIQASGGGNLPGSFYALTSVIDRINGYEIRQADSNTTGIFTINRLGLFTLTVTGAGGCQRTVQWVVQ